MPTLLPSPAAGPRTARGGAAFRRLALLALPAWLCTAAFGAQGRAPVVVVDARTLWTEPALADGDTVYGLEVQDLLVGFVPGSTLVARATATRRTHALTLDPNGSTAEVLRLTLRPLEDGTYEVLRAYPVQPGSASSPDEERHLPGALVVARDENLEPPGDRRRADVPRRVRSALEDDSFEQQVVELVNQERATYGGIERPPLKRVSLLDTSSEGHSSRMETQNFLSHCDLGNGSEPEDRIEAAGYMWNPGAAGENILAGPNTPSDAVGAWMASEPHRLQILDTGVRETGVGFVVNSTELGNITWDIDSNCVGDLINQGPYREYWTQNFGRRNNVYPLVIDREASSTNDQTVELYIYNAAFAGETVMTQMRFSNDDVTYSGWEPYDDQKSWTLSAGGGEKTVWVQLDSADAGTTPDFETSDSIWFESSCTTTTLQNEELDGDPPTYQDCLIVAGPDVDVTGNTTFLADTVSLRSGFRVADGVEFRIGPQP